MAGGTWSDSRHGGSSTCAGRSEEAPPAGPSCAADASPLVGRRGFGTRRVASLAALKEAGCCGRSRSGSERFAGVWSSLVGSSRRVRLTCMLKLLPANRATWTKQVSEFFRAPRNLKDYMGEVMLESGDELWIANDKDGFSASGVWSYDEGSDSVNVVFESTTPDGKSVSLVGGGLSLRLRGQLQRELLVFRSDVADVVIMTRDQGMR
eukprot:TRINITY_DN64799_c0_g1_i1.p1 TRINITY_DN64799_c0_g1~~TRINITY_DN64799_c0_g1_i1.p1  ORF type:complete len:208 (-),score=33.20 TRINITY_DN64799_c0_g1_i1:183-806(-)